MDTALAKIAAELAAASPQAVLAWALQRYTDIALSFSGAEDVVLVDMAAAIRPGVRVFSLDTGRLHPETYRFLEDVRDRYDIQLELLSPAADAVQTLVRTKGLFSFYRDGHRECCAVRKVAPLRRRLRTLEAWVTGQRRDQSPGTRAAVAVVEHDAAFSTPNHALVKVNPLARWTSARVWDYIRDHEVPFNELHLRGFASIGCEPCTRPVLPNQHEREGRWWWEGAARKECGLHPATVEAVGG